jgi:filamentous hemagglutinin
MFTHLYRQSISCILSTVLLGNTLYAGGIVVDNSATASNRPTMESSSNGIPLINIVTPNAAGLSHNKFTEFNIEQRGVIFNNATSAALTQLGGWIAGNANLGMTPARVILNEVTGTNRSLLSGYGERDIVPISSSPIPTASRSTAEGLSTPPVRHSRQAHPF